MVARASARVVVVAAMLVAIGCGGAPLPVGSAPPQRVVSMAPSLTEVLFALGLGDRVVGVTRYCDYPPEAQEVASVGGYLDPNLEALVALEPDLVVLMQDHGELERRFETLGLRTLRVDQHDVAGILASIRAVARACGVMEAGEELAARIEARLRAISRRVEGRPRPRVLVVVERRPGDGGVGSIWVAGRESFLQQVVTLAGGRNAWTDGGAAYPEVSREGLIHLDPDVILELVAEADRRGLDPDQVRRDWDRLRELRAVRSGRVHLLASQAMIRPGPRVAEAVEEVARRLHPGAGWSSP